MSTFPSGFILDLCMCGSRVELIRIYLLLFRRVERKVLKILKERVKA